MVEVRWRGCFNSHIWNGATELRLTSYPRQTDAGNCRTKYNYAIRIAALKSSASSAGTDALAP